MRWQIKQNYILLVIYSGELKYLLKERLETRLKKYLNGSNAPSDVHNQLEILDATNESTFHCQSVD